ncbi:MAG TPA: T9SS type A sorting domain-containing protein, partial [Saprospiraceae bacterium]|nr:T9SS type A sorting domain-containing protein [Saprospiraceae bacterium]
LINGVYTFRYANIDGSNETSKTIDKADHAGQTLAYFSFTTGATVDVEPAGGFDLFFCRYTTLLEAGGDTVPYLVTGILSAEGIETAQAYPVDPETVQFQEYADSLSSNPEIIGHDWKTFDLANFVWVIPNDLVYFVKTRDDHIWKLVFVEFEGSTTGNATFEKTDLGIISAVNDPSSMLTEFQVYPNPAIDDINVLFSLRNNSAAHVKIQVMDTYGHVINQFATSAGDGLNFFTIQKDNLLPGMYFIRLLVDGQFFTERVCITQ